MFLSMPRWGQAQIARVWDKSYGSARAESNGYTVAMPSGGYLLLSGVQEAIFPPPTQARYLLFVRTNAVGDTLWTKKMVPFRTFRPYPSGMILDNTGNILVTGYESSGNGYGFAMKLTAGCDTIWTRRVRYSSPGNSTASYGSPMLTPDGNYALFESTALFGVGITTIYDGYLTKISAATGNAMWRTSFATIFQTNGFSPAYSYVTSITKTPSGFMVFAIGIGSSNFVENPTALILDANGGLTRYRTHSDTRQNSFPVLLVSSDGNVLMGRRQMLTKLTPTGDTLWHTVVPPRLSRSWDAASICEDAQGNYVVAGNSSFNIGSSLYADNIHLTRFHPRTGQVVNDTMLYRPGQTYASTVLRTASGNLVIGGWYNGGTYGGSDAFLTEWTAFRPLAARTGAAVLRAGLQAYPNPAGAGGATVWLPEASRNGGTLTVFDGLGRQCAQLAVKAAITETALSVAALPPGFYLLRYDASDGSHYATRLLRE
jgi:hypothetical protein